MDSLWKEIFLENLVHPGLSGRCRRRAGGVGVRVELFPPNSPVFPGVYHSMQANLPFALELKAELVSRALLVLSMPAFSLCFPFLQLIV